MILRIILAAVEVALLGVFFMTAVDAAIYRSAGFVRGGSFRIDELHHAYIGPPLVVIGWFVSPWLMLAGVLLTADDTYQHWRQTWCAESDYRSPVHVLFAATLWKLRWVQRLTKWLDARL